MNIVVAPSAVLTCGNDAMSRSIEAEKIIGQLPQEYYPVHHLFHAGMYHRTMMIPAGRAITGAIIRKATTLIVSGNAWLNADEPIFVKGHAVLPGMAGRKSFICAISDVWLTMVVRTEMTNVHDVDMELVGDVPLSAHKSENTVVNTGVPA